MPTKSQDAAKLAITFLKEKRPRALGAPRPEKDIADELAKAGGTNRSYIFEAVALKRSAPGLFQKILDGTLSISQANRALMLRAKDPGKYRAIMSAKSPKQARKILGVARVDPVLEIRRLWTACNGRQREAVRKFVNEGRS